MTNQFWILEIARRTLLALSENDPHKYFTRLELLAGLSWKNRAQDC